jgi:hypothetical protein
LSKLFWQRGWEIADNLVTKQHLAFAKAAMAASQRGGRMRATASIVPEGAESEYAPVAGEALLKACQPRIEAIIGRALLPAYALWRIYGHGASLHRHRDRNACEISISLPVFSDPADAPWPIFVSDLHGIETGVPLEPGYGIVYQGCEVAHWREPFPGNEQYLLFLHYVLANGPNAHMANDRREALAIDALIG